MESIAENKTNAQGSQQLLSSLMDSPQHSNGKQDQKNTFLSKLQENQDTTQTKNHITVQKSILGFDTSDETENIFDSDNFIPITSEDKERIYKNWENVLIIKIFGRRVTYQFLQQKIHAIWRPTEHLSLIDLGCDYYLIKFTRQENYDKALHEGPWFIGNQFLTVRKWEPRFIASTASLTFSAIWARLPEFSTKFYDYEILHKIGNKLGKLFRIDVCTTSTTRGKYARLCILTPNEKPLITHIIIGNHYQKIAYEGFNLMCESCGRLGHNTINCPHTASTSKPKPATNNDMNMEVDTLTKVIDYWTIVTHKENATKRSLPITNQIDESAKTTTGQQGMTSVKNGEVPIDNSQGQQQKHTTNPKTC
uniref:CCHC-type domain-containing protein n=1 Tax=Nicotiana tabacum TaxID=4097 RepID=A0A1S3XQQ9_TOBAC|nr:PREDICTED: uncharacterized protein LOC107767720 [Nicotiana tabacum]